MPGVILPGAWGLHAGLPCFGVGRKESGQIPMLQTPHSQPKRGPHRRPRVGGVCGAESNK